jgi:hypothetical protein
MENRGVVELFIWVVFQVVLLVRDQERHILSKTMGKEDHILTKKGLGNHLVMKKSCIFMFHRFLFVNST